ncbi:MAG: hypothetical protein OXU64_05130 [Gemmatimonadota bacterium]|nr:hypothetical protein [Gemmatimonadota bacterium]
MKRAPRGAASSGPPGARSRGFIHGLLAVCLPAALCLGLRETVSAQELPRGRTEPEGVAALAEACAGENPGRVSPCRELALAALAFQRGAGLGSALGSDVPGTASTAGHRLGGVPRIAFSVGLAGIRMGMPRVSARSAGGLAEEEVVTAIGVRGVVAAGIVDGLQLAPGFGGILSVDLTGVFSRLWLPRDAGFEGPSAAVGLGARIGILRESFTVPGISVSLGRRWHGAVRAGDGNPGEVEAQLEVTSARAVLGKNWFALGLLAGAGWDRYAGEAVVSVGGGLDDPGSEGGTLASERTVYFLAGWYNFVISQISAEIGLADGVGSPFPGRSAGYDPGRRDWFASVSVRVAP